MKKKLMRLHMIMRALLAVLCCLIIVGASVSQTDMVDVSATTKEEVEEEKKKAEESEKSAQEVLDNIEEAQNKIVQQVAELDSKATQIQTQITQTEQESQSLQDQIDDNQDKLEKAQAAEDEQYNAMKGRIQYLYEEGTTSYIDVLLSSGSFAEVINSPEYIDQLSEYDKRQLASLTETKKSIADYKEALESDLRQVEALKTDLNTYKENLQSAIDEKEEIISQYDEDIEAQTALVAKFTAQRESLENQITELSRQESERSGAVYTMDGTVYDTSGYAGRFMWPVATGGTITSGFGYRNAPTAGASSYHQGIDIGCSYGTDILAADDGTVIMSCYNGGAGNMVMISHDDGICTVYMHNSQLCVNVGERVVKGQVIAKAGSTGVSTGTHCHFGVKINGTYVNPQDFL